MANFFSADYWKALYFKAMGGQETATDPNAMSGTFAGSADFTGTLDGTGAAVEEPGGWFWPRLKTRFERARDKAEAEKERLRRLRQIEEDEARALSIFGRTDKTPAPIEPELPPIEVADPAPPVSKPTESLRSPPEVINRRILTLPLRKPDQDAAAATAELAAIELEAADALVVAAELQATKARAKRDEEEALILLLLAS